MSQSAGGIRSVDRAVCILQVLSESGMGLGVTEIAQLVGLEKSTTHRLLTALARSNLVRRDLSGRRYGIGYGVLQLATGWLNGIEIRTMALPHMRALREKTGETIALNLRDGAERVAVERLDTSQEVRFVVELWRPLPLHVGASGKAILAFLPDEQIRELMKQMGVGPRKTQALLEDLQAISQQGFAHTAGERVAGSRAVSAAVFDHHGLPVASISLLSLQARLSANKAHSFGRLVCRTARDISMELGWREHGNAASNQVRQGHATTALTGA